MRRTQRESKRSRPPAFCLAPWRTAKRTSHHEFLFICQPQQIQFVPALSRGILFKSKLRKTFVFATKSQSNLDRLLVGKYRFSTTLGYFSFENALFLKAGEKLFIQMVVAKGFFYFQQHQKRGKNECQCLRKLFFSSLFLEWTLFSCNR